MGWFKRAASAVNTHHDVATELTVALSPSIRRVRKLEARGVIANGVITGIRFRLDDGTTRKDFAISVLDGGAVRRIGVRTQPGAAHRLRLGMPVVVRLDGDRGVLDWAAMADAWGLPAGSFPQESLRKPPDDGIEDTALDMRVQRRLKKWQPVDATIVSLQRCSVMGTPTLNWDIQLRLPNGETAVSARDEVPTYAQWDAAPGAVVPAVVDPSAPSKASVDWPAFALSRFDTVGFDDDPPPGSLAAELEAADLGTATAASVAPPPPPPPPPPGAPVALDATLQAWVDARRSGHMGPKDFERVLADWQAAGMCTPAHAEAARAQTAQP